MVRNHGIIATGGSQVAGNAVASGSNAKAEVQGGGPVQSAGDRQYTPEEIGGLLTRLIEELGRSAHPERADLIEAAQDARDELGSPAPRVGKLKLISRALVDAVPGVTALASLAATIEEAIRAL
ncbi:hypothetical protein HZZ00_32375 [Streptomyces sp. NEAU-sy36]|uniref:hypothetical protein n=1 Tax=unclassified Streptomyces TaxID=2593676 RepID=UPI0015D5F2AF|nr:MULTISPECIES: hypothetical protein [unclassified Streptomyces]QLJ05259.1 hypothetical protein HZZ00_32375 [Streptomyces sp. NEAU-sy36]